MFVVNSDEEKKNNWLANLLYDETVKPMASPRANRPRLRKMEGGSPYEPMTREAVGKTTNGHQLRVVAVVKKDSFMDDATAAVSSRVFRISLVMLLACFSMLEWSSNFVDSFSVVESSRSMPCSIVTWRCASRAAWSVENCFRRVSFKYRGRQKPGRTHYLLLERAGRGDGC